MRELIARAAGLGGLLVLGVAVTAAPSSAAVDIFLKLQGIPGSSRDARHKDEIEVNSIQYGLNNTGTQSFGGGGGAGKVQFQDISFTKKVDKSSPALMTSCLNGARIPQAVIALRKAGSNPVDFYKVTLSDVLVSGYSIGSGGEAPMESISLNFAKVDWEYLVQSPDGSLKPGAKGGWDVRASKASTGAATSPSPGGAGAPTPSRLPIFSAGGFFGGGSRPRGIGNPTIFAKVDGIEGESRDERHKNEIEIHSFSWGATNPGLLAAGSGAGTGKVKIGDWNGTKAIDRAGVPLMIACASGKHIPTVVITLVKNSTDRPEFLKITLTDVLVTSYSHSAADGADIPMESLSLNFSKMEWEFKEQNAQGQMVPVGKAGYDLRTSKAL